MSFLAAVLHLIALSFAISGGHMIEKQEFGGSYVAIGLAFVLAAIAFVLQVMA